MKEFGLIRNWAIERGIAHNSTIKDQFLKLAEEMGELADAINKNKAEQFIDSIGDCTVVLTILAQLQGLTIEECVRFSWNQIKVRKGMMINGVFVKDSKIIFQHLIDNMDENDQILAGPEIYKKEDLDASIIAAEYDNKIENRDFIGNQEGYFNWLLTKGEHD
jgi:phosphoribosyl-ATP pyrophosphohydrolase